MDLSEEMRLMIWRLGLVLEDWEVRSEGLVKFELVLFSIEMEKGKMRDFVIN